MQVSKPNQIIKVLKIFFYLEQNTFSKENSRPSFIQVEVSNVGQDTVFCFYHFFFNVIFVILGLRASTSAVSKICYFHTSKSYFIILI